MEGSRLRWSTRAARGGTFVLDRTCLDCIGDSIGDQAEHAGVVLVEDSIDEGADMEHAQKPRAKLQWYPEHRPDAPLPQDRILDRRRVDVVEEHRTSFGGDPAGEAGTHLYPHPLTDFFFHTDGRSCDKLVGSRLEEEHRCGIYSKQASDLCQELHE